MQAQIFMQPGKVTRQAKARQPLTCRPFYGARAVLSQTKQPSLTVMLHTYTFKSMCVEVGG
eukprot:scaffold286397_cov19-Tisochrysis_lutea.AAC.2